MAATEKLIDGVLPVDKPRGPTSHAMVAHARRALGTRRIGHTGTLDPFASGLLLLCIGRATRIAEYLSGMDKRYRAVVRLGVTTDTDDDTGRVTAERDSDGITADDVEGALAALRGDVMQRPSTFSAKKVEGQRAYALARQGRMVALEPVLVSISQLAVTRFAVPDIEIDVTCSSGTYIRAIARDLGDALGVGAHLTSLRRTAVGPHPVEQAVSADALVSDPDAVRRMLIPTLDALGSMPRVELSADDVVHIRHGRALARDIDLSGSVALAANGELVAIADAADGMIRPRKVFL
jgi:tRNA pseudouridine55 synthase